MKRPKYLLVSLLTGLIMTLTLLSAGAAPPQEQDPNPEVTGAKDDFSANQFDSSRTIVANGESSGFIANDQRGNLASAFSQALKDPLSYAPAGTIGLAGSLDWASSQRYFRQGWLEANPRFTTSGGRNAEPIDPAAGYQRIVVREVLPMLATSMAVNTFSHWLEQKGSRRLGRILRWASWGALTAVSARSFSQWHRNQAGMP